MTWSIESQLKQIDNQLKSIRIRPRSGEKEKQPFDNDWKSNNHKSNYYHQGQGFNRDLVATASAGGSSSSSVQKSEGEDVGADYRELIKVAEGVLTVVIACGLLAKAAYKEIAKARNRRRARKSRFVSTPTFSTDWGSTQGEVLSKHVVQGALVIVAGVVIAALLKQKW